MMMYKKHLFFMIITFILVILVGGSTSTYNLVVQGKPIAGGHIECDRDFFGVTCCWWEDFGDYISYVCQTCDEDGSGCGPIVKTDPRSLEEPPTSPSTDLPVIPGGNGVLEQPPTSPQQGHKSGLEDEASKGSVFEQRSMYTSPQIDETSPQIARPTTGVDQENKTPSN